MNIAQTYHVKASKADCQPEAKHAVAHDGWMLSSLLHSGSVHLTKMASKLPSQAKNLSKADRLPAFLNNRHVHVSRWYRPAAVALLGFDQPRPLLNSFCSLFLNKPYGS